MPSGPRPVFVLGGGAGGGSTGVSVSATSAVCRPYLVVQRMNLTGNVCFVACPVALQLCEKLDYQVALSCDENVGDLTSRRHWRLLNTSWRALLLAKHATTKVL